MTHVQIELLNMVLLLLSTMVASAVLGAYLFREVMSWILIIVTFVISIVAIFVSSTVTGATGAFAVSVILGFSMGAMIGGFVNALTKDNPRGKLAVVVTLGILLLILVIAAAIGLFSGFDFSGARGTMGIILLGILGFSLLGLVINYGRVIELISSLAISAFFAFYLVVHLNAIKLVTEVATWSDALHIAMGAFLDLVNIFIRLLPLILKVLSKH